MDEKGENTPSIILSSATVPPKHGDGSGSSAGDPLKIELTHTNTVTRSVEESAYQVLHCLTHDLMEGRGFRTRIEMIISVSSSTNHGPHSLRNLDPLHHGMANQKQHVLLTHVGVKSVSHGWAILRNSSLKGQQGRPLR